MSIESAAELIRRAADGDQDAWRALVDRYSVMVWRVARAHRLDHADAADVSQSTWVALAEHIGELRAPERLAAWLSTTARRESLRVLAHRGREVRAAAWPDRADAAQEDRWPEATALRGARDDALWRAFASLPGRCRELLGLLAFAPELTYAQLGRALGLATGSVGTTRGRCLDVLRRKLTALGLPREAAG
ncbi:RNA polymerase sigma factor [Actinokineospora iranica]|uniref:RNA polymerase sigma factor, sigma-70 family n=1 Tax=Actinokineospora iranica TaxID=1271860 RepID=A0A1G6QK46_9PSEU|nr:sigma-70 family RNA polymerase sigma factor [Actinokineospora iranica]SDC92812.1 RNA polymerase sigma factor, sigma-70 family [Actinokineospora iranica]